MKQTKKDNGLSYFRIEINAPVTFGLVSNVGCHEKKLCLANQENGKLFGNHYFFKLALTVNRLQSNVS